MGLPSTKAGEFELMVEQAKILKVIGVTKAPTGRGVLLTGEIEDRGIVEMLVHRHHFPWG